MSWWDAVWFALGWCLGWAFILTVLVWAGRNKERILAWYLKRSMASDPERWRPSAPRDLP